MAVFRILALLFVVVAILNRIFDGDLGNAFVYIAAVAEVSLIGIIIYTLVKARKEFKKGQSGTMDKWELTKNVLTRASIPPLLAEIVISELRIIFAFLQVLTLRPLRNFYQAQPYHPLNGSMYPKLLVAVGFIVILEIPAMHFLFHAIMDEGTARSIVQGVFLFFGIYGLVWLMGDLRLLKESRGIFFEEDMMKIRMGLRANADIPVNKILRAEKSTPPDPLPGQFTAQESGTLQVTVFDKPNVLLSFDSALSIRMLFGMEKSTKFLRLYLPDPDDFVKSFQEEKS
jgi:hypothetical protein